MEVGKERVPRCEKRQRSEAEHERVQGEGEAPRGENEGVLRRRGESERNSLRQCES